MKSKEEVMKEYQDRLDELKAKTDMSIDQTNGALANLTLAVIMTVFIDIRDILAAMSSDLDMIRSQGGR